MAEEFPESEVIFSDANHRSSEHDGPHKESKTMQDNSSLMNCSKSDKKTKKMVITHSLPVKIPCVGFQCRDHIDDFDRDEMIPPHIIVARRVATEEMTFSACSGNGRRLRGRDLSHVRNSILRRTGFLET